MLRRVRDIRVQEILRLRERYLKVVVVIYADPDFPCLAVEDMAACFLVGR